MENCVNNGNIVPMLRDAFLGKRMVKGLETVLANEYIKDEAIKLDGFRFPFRNFSNLHGVGYVLVDAEGLYLETPYIPNSAPRQTQFLAKWGDSIEVSNILGIELSKISVDSEDATNWYAISYKRKSSRLYSD